MRILLQVRRKSKLQVEVPNTISPPACSLPEGGSPVEDSMHEIECFKQWGSFHFLLYFPKISATEKENYHPNSCGQFTGRHLALLS